MAEEKVDAKTATEKTMQVITGPVIATTLVLLAVFVPATLMPGITGRLYQQFALTISVATCISSLNALTFAPALCGLLLRPAPARRGLFFRGFDAALEGTRAVYLFGVRALCRRLLIGAPLFLALLAATAFGFAKLPTGFLPDEDQGYCLAHLQLPEGATLERTIAVAERLERELSQIPGIAFVTRIAGFNLLDSVGSQSCGIYFIAFDPWSERPQPERHAQALVAQMNRRWSQEPAALAFGFLPPPIAGLGNATGFDLRLLDLGGFGPERQLGQAVELLRAAQQDGRVTRLNLNLRLDAPQVYVDLDREKAKRLGVPLQVVFDTLQAALGSAYVNDFDVFGKSFRVLVQADARFRDELEDIRKLEVRSAAGAMVPLGTLVRLEERAGPPTLTRFDNSASVTITGQPAPGISSGEALRAMEELAVRVLPSGATTAWSGVSYQQKAAGDTAPLVFALALLFAFLFLAAQYESWSAPLAVLLNAPIALLGGLALTAALRLDNNIYTQIGFVLLIGLASKNAILIVELAKERVAAGASVLDAAIEAARERYRAILMTALSFLLGVLPLLFASGAGAASRRALGAAVLGGMGLATTLGIFLIPMLYVLVGKIARVRPAVREDSNAPGGSPDAA
jgi:HAE1 family hydrophobic/amphiphilic exporter-1